MVQLGLLGLMLLAEEDYVPCSNLPPMTCATLWPSQLSVCVLTSLIQLPLPLFWSCRLIALNKNTGVRPIGIGDTARRNIAKAVLMVTRSDIQEAAGSLQLCAGQISGIEAAVHAVDALFQRDETEAILLVDASNAFNSLKRLSALHNIHRLRPSPATALINTYRAPGLLLSFLSMVRCSTPVKASLKETPSLCQCMHLQQFPLLRSYSVIWLMLVKCGMQMMPLLLGKSLDYVSGGVNYPHKVPSMATLPMPPKRGWSQK